MLFLAHTQLAAEMRRPWPCCLQSTNPSRIASNLTGADGFALTSEEMNSIATIQGKEKYAADDIA